MEVKEIDKSSAEEEEKEKRRWPWSTSTFRRLEKKMLPISKPEKETRDL